MFWYGPPSVSRTPSECDGSCSDHYYRLPTGPVDMPYAYDHWHRNGQGYGCPPPGSYGRSATLLRSLRPPPEPGQTRQTIYQANDCIQLSPDAGTRWVSDRIATHAPETPWGTFHPPNAHDPEGIEGVPFPIVSIQPTVVSEHPVTSLMDTASVAESCPTTVSSPSQRSASPSSSDSHRALSELSCGPRPGSSLSVPQTGTGTGTATTPACGPLLSTGRPALECPEVASVEVPIRITDMHLGMWACDDCGKSFRRKQRAWIHFLNKHGGLRLGCRGACGKTACVKTFACREALDTHINPTLIRCECGKLLLKKNIRRHRKEHCPNSPASTETSD